MNGPTPRLVWVDELPHYERTGELMGAEDADEIPDLVERINARMHEKFPDLPEDVRLEWVPVVPDDASWITDRELPPEEVAAFEALLAESSLGAPRVQEAKEELPPHVRARLDQYLAGLGKEEE
jgi:hypothetical protein